MSLQGYWIKMQSSALEGQRREGVNKKRTWKGQGKLPGETKGLGYLGHLDSQKSRVAGMCDSEENIAEPVVEGLRCMFRIISLRIYWLMLMAYECWLSF